jgi:hypothetical protein
MACAHLRWISKAKNTNTFHDKNGYSNVAIYYLIYVYCLSFFTPKIPADNNVLPTYFVFLRNKIYLTSIDSEFLDAIINSSCCTQRHFRVVKFSLCLDRKDGSKTSFSLIALAHYFLLRKCSLIYSLLFFFLFFNINHPLRSECNLCVFVFVLWGRRLPTECTATPL